MNKFYGSNDPYDDPFPSLPPQRAFRLDGYAILLCFTFVALGTMGYAFFSTLRPVDITIGVTTRTVWTNQTTVARVINDAAIILAPEDTIFPAPDELVPDDQPILIQLAQPITIQLDDRIIPHRTHSTQIADALREAGVLLSPHDRVSLNGKSIDPKSKLPHTIATVADDPTQYPRLFVERAVPIRIDDNGQLSTFYTTAPTLGQALNQAGMLVYLGDYISPDLGTPVEPDYQVFIRRSRPLNISVEGKTVRTRTRSDSVSKVLEEEGIQLSGKDYTIPNVNSGLSDGITIQVIRVREETLVESEAIPFDTLWQADPTLELDDHEVTQVGVEGVKKRSILIRYENGRELRRTIEREWVDAAPTTKTINYGTKLVHHDLTLPDGAAVTYWRKLRIHATSYTAATSGKARTHPEFGITYTGMQAGKGIVAVDPRVINLRTKLYVPGYSDHAVVAGDTGGRIKGLRVDLGYDESNLELWYKWVDVYLLDPPPTTDQIHYIVPDPPRSAFGR